MENLVLIKIEQREKVAEGVQNLLTEFGCSIKTRIGFHEAAANVCASGGLIILQLIPGAEADKLKNELGSLEGVSIGKVCF
ncbi:MAG: hypothetical protein GX817_00235 [Elusimicrobia bacterium]|nr:hypothetical protein [Elusimicrobiota bacterium]